MFSRKNKNISRRPVLDRPTSSVFSYHASRSPYAANLGRHEQPAARQSFSVQWHWLPTWLAALAIIASLCYIGTLTTNPRIVMASDAGAVTRPASVYQAFAQSQLQSSVLNKAKLTINTDSLAKQMQEHFPELDAVSVTVPVFARRPIIQVQASVPAFALSGKDGVFYIRSNGMASVKLGDIAGGGSPQVVVDQSGLPVAPGKLALPKDTVAFLSEVIRQVRAKGLVIDQIILPAVPYEAQLRLKGQPYYVRFSTNGDARTEVGTFFAVKEQLDGQHAVPKEYVDVRVEERAYYK
jgi:hypothetical protein